METVLQSIHFRKIFFLICVLVLVVLFAIKYIFVPVIHRNEAQPKKILRHILDTLIGLIIALMVIAALAFAISGNE